MKKLFTVHIETSAGARFSHHDSEEEIRVELIEYYNTARSDGGDDDLALDATLEEAIEKVEETENVSIDESWVPDVWVLVVDDHSTGTSVELHKSRREALDSVGSAYDPDTDTSAMSDDEYSEHLVAVLEANNASWFVLENKELP